MIAYNPFARPIGSTLDLADLQSLAVHGVAEGYYVEYKSDFQTPEKMSHSLASLSNTYGGWFLVGVVADRQSNVPISFSGLDLTQDRDPISTVRDVARQRIDPMPLFFSQLVAVDATHAILVVYVPEGEDTPYVTRDGRIYRRAADSSDPTFEHDRFALDRLVQQGANAVHDFDNFCSDDRQFCKAEEGQGWIELYLSPYPRELVHLPGKISSDHLDALVEASKQAVSVPVGDGGHGIDVSVPFNHAQVCVGSAVLRQVNAGEVVHNSLQMVGHRPICPQRDGFLACQWALAEAAVQGEHAAIGKVGKVELDGVARLLARQGHEARGERLAGAQRERADIGQRPGQGVH